MVYSIIGKEIVSGEYQGRKYEHLKLYCTILEGGPTSPSLEGDRCEVIKVKNNSSSLYSRLSVGDSVCVYYDRYGNPCEVVLQE